MAKAAHKPDTQAEEMQNIDPTSGDLHAGKTTYADPVQNDSDKLVAASAGQVISSASQAVNQALKTNSVITTGTAVAADELNNIDFVKLIGGPLQAAIDAQVASSLATINFIQTVGLEPLNDTPKEERLKVRMVDFKYFGPPATGGGTQVDKTITVPFLAIVPIPSLRIESVDINFNVKLESIQTQEIKETKNTGLDVGGGFAKLKLKVTAATQRSTTTGIKMEKEYTLNVKVRAVQDEIPAGLEKVLNILSAQ